MDILASFVQPSGLDLIQQSLIAALRAAARVRILVGDYPVVAVATGLGKTWLAAFDVVAVGKTLGRPPRVLIIAHRAEILIQAEDTFTPGLTATPERTDGVDVASLFDDVLAWHATVGDGIVEGSLVPFHYLGIKDDVDFAPIPWRNGRFDPAVLKERLENSQRMERLWTAWQVDPDARTLVFCCSRRHALYTRDWLRRRHVRASAVFSGAGSDPRSDSLSDFIAGRLPSLCVVDLFPTRYVHRPRPGPLHGTQNQGRLMEPLPAVPARLARRPHPPRPIQLHGRSGKWRPLQREENTTPPKPSPTTPGTTPISISCPSIPIMIPSPSPPTKPRNSWWSGNGWVRSGDGQRQSLPRPLQAAGGQRASVHVTTGTLREPP